ncbi:MAG: outer membrane lipoprotein carrier protein LolA, partial [Alphaproteobacteria bacterium]
MLAAVAWSGGPAQAAPYTPEQQAAIRQVEAYLQNLKTLESRFVQNNPDGTTSQGKMYLRRPGYLRFEYDPPVPVLLISNGLWLIHVDHELKSSNYLPLNQTPAYFLVRENMSLSDGLTVTGVQMTPGAIRVRVIEQDEPEVGTVILTFSERPFELRQWQIVDAIGKTVHITLVNPKFGAKIDPTIFAFS